MSFNLVFSKTPLCLMALISSLLSLLLNFGPFCYATISYLAVSFPAAVCTQPINKPVKPYMAILKQLACGSAAWLTFLLSHIIQW
jgi:hypothetical protein